jgi:hypothetical protein
MKPEQIYDELKNLAEKLGVTVEEHNFGATGVKANSGLCKIRGKPVFIMDKNKSIAKKTRLLAGCLAQLPHENVYVVPAVRELLTEMRRTGPDLSAD